MRKAIVYCHYIEAGLLEEATPGRGYTFTYDKQYMMDTDSFFVYQSTSKNKTKLRSSESTECGFCEWASREPE